MGFRGAGPPLTPRDSEQVSLGSPSSAGVLSASAGDTGLDPVAEGHLAPGALDLTDPRPWAGACFLGQTSHVAGALGSACPKAAPSGLLSKASGVPLPDPPASPAATPTPVTLTPAGIHQHPSASGADGPLRAQLRKAEARELLAWHWLLMALRDLEFLLHFVWLGPQRRLQVLPKEKQARHEPGGTRRS